MIVDAVNSFIPVYCNREFGEGIFTERNEGIVDYRGRFLLKVRNAPLSQVISAEVKMYGSQQTIPLDVNYLDVFKPEGYAYYNYIYPAFDGIIREEFRDQIYYDIVYSGGGPIPAALKLAASNMVWDSFQNFESNAVVSGEIQAELTSMSLGDYSESYKPISSKTNNYKSANSGLIVTPTTESLMRPFVHHDQSW